MIDLLTVKFKNFKSFGNIFSEFNFKRPGMNMIIGENLDCPDSSNGSGKCLRKNTVVEVSFENDEIEKLFKDFD